MRRLAIRAIGAVVAFILLAGSVAQDVGAAEPAPPPAVAAPIALLVDADSGQVLFSREPDRRFMPASITKVMTTYVAFELMRKGELKPDRLMRMSDEAFKAWSRKGSTMFLPRGAVVSVDDLLFGINTVSANDGAIVLAEGAAGSVPAWVARMNIEAQRLGMADSHFGTPNGWPDEGRTFVTARDLVTLGSALVNRHPEAYRRYIGNRSFAYNGIAQPNHDPITGVVQGADGIKTGFTRQAGYGFLGSASRGGKRLLMVVAGCPTGSDRKRAAREFMEWGFHAFEARPIFPRNHRMGFAPVHDGASRRVALLAARPVAPLVPRGSKAKMTYRVRYDQPVRAPVERGEEVARLEVLVDGKAAGSIPLAAGADIARAGWWDRLRNALLGLFE